MGNLYWELGMGVKMRWRLGEMGFGGLEVLTDMGGDKGLGRFREQCKGSAEVRCLRAMTADSIGEGELRSPWESQCRPSAGPVQASVQAQAGYN